MKKIPLSQVKDDLSRYLRMAAKETVVITRRGKPAGVLVGFSDEHDWLDYLLENHPRFLRRINAARAGLRAGRGVRLEDGLSEAAPRNARSPRRLRDRPAPARTARKGTRRTG